MALKRLFLGDVWESPRRQSLSGLYSSLNQKMVLIRLFSVILEKTQLCVFSFLVSQETELIE